MYKWKSKVIKIKIWLSVVNSTFFFYISSITRDVMCFSKIPFLTRRRISESDVNLPNILPSKLQVLSADCYQQLQYLYYILCNTFRYFKSGTGEIKFPHNSSISFYKWEMIFDMVWSNIEGSKRCKIWEKVNLYISSVLTSSHP